MLSFGIRRSARNGRRAGILAGAAVVALGIIGAGAGSASAAPQCNGTSPLEGEGSSLQKIAQQEVWNPKYHAACPTVEIKYTSTGSGPGLTAWGFKGGTFEKKFGFIGSDDAPNATQIKNAETASGSKILVVPVAQTAIGVVVNPPSNCQIEEITNKQLESVMRGNIKSWGKILTASGAGCEAPITRVVRAEGSGTTYQFKNYLQQINPAPLACTEGGGKTWAQLEEVGAEEKPNITWPANGLGGCTSTQLSPIVTGAGGGALVKKVNSTEGSIGYAALPDIEFNKNLGTENPNGDTAALRLQNNGLSNKLVNATFAQPGDEFTLGANCSHAVYTVPTAGRAGSGSGEDVDWSTVFGAAPAIGGENYPLCTLTYELSLKTYSAAGFAEGTELTARDYINNYLTTTQGQSDLAGSEKFYSALPSESNPAYNVLGAAQLASGKIAF